MYLVDLTTNWDKKNVHVMVNEPSNALEDEAWK